MTRLQGEEQKDMDCFKFWAIVLGEEEDTPTRKRVTWSESLEERLGTAEANNIQGRKVSLYQFINPNPH